MSQNSYDHDDTGRSARRDEPDAHGQAALMLAEATLHALVEASMLTVAEALAVVTTAKEVKAEVAALEGESKGRMQSSLDLLTAITRSFESDLNQPGAAHGALR